MEIDSVLRFNDFRPTSTSPKAALCDRLSDRVDDGVLERRPDPEHARRHFYELTSAGRDLWPALRALLVWGNRHRAPNSRDFKHAGCETLTTMAAAHVRHNQTRSTFRRAATR
jgi:DNA-binding HxlR family transcriptional regulator